MATQRSLSSNHILSDLHRYICASSRRQSETYLPHYKLARRVPNGSHRAGERAISSRDRCIRPTLVYWHHVSSRNAGHTLGDALAPEHRQCRRASTVAAATATQNDGCDETSVTSFAPHQKEFGHHDPSNLVMKAQKPDRIALGTCKCASLPDVRQPEFQSNYDSILEALNNHGLSAGRRQLQATMFRYIRSGSSEDWLMAHNLFFSVAKNNPSFPVLNTAHALVHWMWKQEKTRPEAVLLLVDGHRFRTRINDSPFLHYLEYCFRRDSGATYMQSVTATLFEAMRIHEISIDSLLLRPAVTALLREGSVADAVKWIDEMCQTYNLTLETHIRQLLIDQLGRGQFWHGIDAHLTLLHEVGSTRMKTHTSNSVVLRALMLFAQHNTTSRMHDFLTYCIREHGITPTKHLSRHAYMLFFRSRQYRLARMWTQILQDRFPRVAWPEGSVSLAYHISELWHNTSATCEDVFRICKSLTRLVSRSNFSAEFRYLAVERLFIHLRKCCDALARTTAVRLDFKEFDSIYTVFETIHGMLTAPANPVHLTRHALQRDHVRKQLHIAQDTMLLLDNPQQYLGRYGFESLKATESESDDADVPLLRDNEMRVNARFWETVLTYQQVKTEFLSRFVEQESNSQEFNETLSLLYMNQRTTQLAHLIRWSYAQPKMRSLFTIDTLCLWVTTAAESKNRLSLVRALWALINAPTKFKIPSRIPIFVSSLIASDHFFVRFEPTNEAEYTELKSELIYLNHRITRRVWCEMGCPPAEALKESPLYKWRVDARMDEDVGNAKTRPDAVKRFLDIERAEAAKLVATRVRRSRQAEKMLWS